MPVPKRFVGDNMSPDWSPDGGSLVYISRRGAIRHVPGSTKLVVAPVDARGEAEAMGEELVVAPELRLGNLRWSPVGRLFATQAMDRNGRSGLYLVSETGAAELVVPGAGRRPVWSRDGKRLFYAGADPQTKFARILSFDLESREEAVLFEARSTSRAVPRAASRDGAFLLAHVSDHDGESVMLLPLEGSEPRRVFTVEQPARVQPWDLTPDGRFALCTRPSVDGDRDELWRVDVESGAAEYLGLAMTRLRHVRVHPDGDRIAFTAGAPSQEIFVLEDFLPL